MHCIQLEGTSDHHTTVALTLPGVSMELSVSDVPAGEIQVWWGSSSRSFLLCMTRRHLRN